MARIGAVVRCADVPRQVFDTVAAIARQTRPVEAVTLVVDPTTPVAARPWLNALAVSRGWAIVDAPSACPGVVWNSGIDAIDAGVLICVSTGDLLDPDYTRLAFEQIETASADVVTCRILRAGPGSDTRTERSIDWAASPLTRPADARQAPLMLTRALWSELAGFDRSLPTFEDLDLCCRAYAAGRRGVCLGRPLVLRPYRRDGSHAPARTDPHRSAALAEIAARYAETIGDQLSAVFDRAQAHREALRARNEDLLAKRERAMAQLDALRKRAAELRAMLPEADQRSVSLGDLRRTTPVSRDWGYDRGGPVDRAYIEQFLARHAGDIAGDVLEVQEPDYTRRFGGDRVTRSDVVDLDPANPRATIVSDLRSAANIASATYDCVILTQTLHVIDDMAAVAAECARVLKPGGVLLATLPSASRVCVEYGYGGDFWRVTEAGARRVFAGAFSPDAIEIEAPGNVLANAAFLYGLGSGELTAADYAASDPYYPLLITVRARKRRTEVTEEEPEERSGGHGGTEGGPEERSGGHGGAEAARGVGAILMYHRVASPSSDVHHLSVAPEDFRAQMEHLRDRYHPMPLLEFANAAARNALPPGAVAVTFDDGYLDNYTIASPILSAVGIPATFFLTTDRLDEAYEFWWDALERVLFGAKQASASDLTVALPGGSRTFPAMTADDRRLAHTAIYDAVVGAPAEERDRAIDDVRRWSGDSAADPDARRMNRSEMVELARRRGHTIGAHSVRHLMLPRQTADVRRREIEDCRRTLRDVAGTEVAAFAYPFGAVDADTRDEVRAAGFHAAVACDDAAILAQPDVLSLPRLDPVGSRGSEPFNEWLRRLVAPAPRAQAGLVRRRALVAGWFSYSDSDSTAGDFLASDVVCEWLTEAGFTCDIALAPPFTGGVDLDRVDPAAYSHAVFVCGPFMPNRLEAEFASRFASCTIVGVNVSLPVPLEQWNPFHLLFERDSNRSSSPDISFASHEPGVPVVGVCLVEPYGGADTAAANAAIERLVASKQIAVVPIDTRLDVNTTGLRTKAEVESLLARMDVVVTTRLHGTVLALKHGVPVVSIDPEPGGFRLKRQAEALGWPVIFTVDALDDAALRAALDYCLTDVARLKAADVRNRAVNGVVQIRRNFIDALTRPAPTANAR